MHFSEEEFAARHERLRSAMSAAYCDGLVLFCQESMYYLTGYDTSGYSMFQGMYFGADGAIALLTRSADERQARITSIVRDVRIWSDREGATPGDDLRGMLEDLGCRGRRIGIEYHAYGLTAQRGKMVDDALEGFCETFDASHLARDLRMVKSTAELAYVRKAGALADEAFAVARDMTRPGASIGSIYGAMMNVVMSGDGDPSASRWPMGRAEEALLIRYHTGHGTVGEVDQVQFEFASAYRHYHAGLMNVILTGGAAPEYHRMFDACADALAACKNALMPGRPLGDVYDAHARVLSGAGYEKHILKACGYSMGATYPPTWMDMPMIYAGNSHVVQPGMVFFLHMQILDSDSGRAMSLGEQVHVTPGGCERITHAPDRLIVV